MRSWALKRQRGPQLTGYSGGAGGYGAIGFNFRGLLHSSWDSAHLWTILGIWVVRLLHVDIPGEGGREGGRGEVKDGGCSLYMLKTHTVCTHTHAQTHTSSKDLLISLMLRGRMYITCGVPTCSRPSVLFTTAIFFLPRFLSLSRVSGPFLESHTVPQSRGSPLFIVLKTIEEILVLEVVVITH